MAPPYLFCVEAPLVTERWICAEGTARLGRCCCVPCISCGQLPDTSFGPQSAALVDSRSGSSSSLLGSSSSVRMPGGTIVDVGIAPLIACAVLGGPAAGVAAAAIGVFELREVRGLIPAVRNGSPLVRDRLQPFVSPHSVVMAVSIYGWIAGSGFPCRCSVLVRRNRSWNPPFRAEQRADGGGGGGARGPTGSARCSSRICASSVSASRGWPRWHG